MIYYGLEQDLSDGSADPSNREALWLYSDFSTTATQTYGRISTVNKVRKALNGDSSFLNSVATVKMMQDQDIALSRGSSLIVLTNVSEREAAWGVYSLMNHSAAHLEQEVGRSEVQASTQVRR